MNIIKLHEDLIDNHNIHQFSIITGKYLYEIMHTYYLSTRGECFSCPWENHLHYQIYKKHRMDNYNYGFRLSAYYTSYCLY